MSIRTPPPPPRPARASLVVVANLVGLLLLLLAASGLSVAAYLFDFRAGLALSSLCIGVGGWPLTRMSDGA